MSKRPQRINSICQGNSTLHQLSQRAKLLEQLNYTLQQALPTPFAAHCRLANIADTTLIIHTDNASYASLIRFQAPVLCKTLSTKLAIAIDKVEVKVRPHYIPLQQTTLNAISLPKSAATSLQQIAKTIDNDPLKIALEKLAKRTN